MQNPFVAQSLDDVRQAPDNIKLVDSSAVAAEADPSLTTTIQWKVKKHARSGSIITDDRLRVKLEPSTATTATTTANLQTLSAIHPDVFALGDCGIIQDTSYPATAQVASQKALWLTKRLNAGDLHKTSFTYKDLGTLAYIGNWDALFQGGGGGRLQGYLAWIMWRGAYLTKTVSWRNKILVPVYWAVNWLFGRDISRF